MAVITDFFRGTTKEFTVTITKDSVVQDIASDTVTVRFKNNKDDTDANAVIEETADVATDGANGNAIFKLLHAITNIPIGRYFIDITWVDGVDEFVVYSNEIQIIERVSE